MALRAGMLVGEYRVVRKLGAGGMGEVFLAMHDQLGQRVILKGLHPELIRDPEMRQRLTREAQAMARLQHPHIVQIFNYLEAPEGDFIVMEYVEGQTLDDVLAQRGPLPPVMAIELFRQVLSAVAYAHEHAVIHRDIKPSNIMVSPTGHVHVVDFGTAKLVDRPGMTRIGMTLGTASYMSPEQLTGQPLDATADIYSIGATLYELLTGHLPFECDTTVELARKIVSTAPVAPSIYRPTLPGSLERVVLCCLAKHPSERYASARDLLAALEGVLQELQGGARGAAAGATATPTTEAPPAPGQAASPAPVDAGGPGAGATAAAQADDDDLDDDLDDVDRETASAPGASTAAAPGAGGEASSRAQPDALPVGHATPLLTALCAGAGLAGAAAAGVLLGLGSAGAGAAVAIAAAGVAAITAVVASVRLQTAAVTADSLRERLRLERARARDAAKAEPAPAAAPPGWGAPPPWGPQPGWGGFGAAPPWPGAPGLDAPGWGPNPASHAMGAPWRHAPFDPQAMPPAYEPSAGPRQKTTLAPAADA